MTKKEKPVLILEPSSDDIHGVKGMIETPNESRQPFITVTLPSGEVVEVTLVFGKTRYRDGWQTLITFPEGSVASIKVNDSEEDEE